MTNCRVGCQRAALHFDDDSQWHGAFDPLPSFVNKEYTLIDATHIMAVWELAGEKKTCLSCWKAPCLCCWGPSWREALLSCFQHLTLYNAYYGSLPCTAAIYPLSCAACLISAAFDQHPRLFKSTDSPNTDWVSYSYVLKWTFSAYHTHNVTWQSRVRISLNQP